MIKRIAVIELHYHHKVVQQFLDLLEHTGVELTLVTLQEIHAILDIPEHLVLNLYSFPTRKEAFHFLQSHQLDTELNIITTIALKFLWNRSKKM